MDARAGSPHIDERHMNIPRSLRMLHGVLLTLCGALPMFGADQPQWGQAWSRNLVSEERNLPESFDPDTGKNIKWTAKLGSETHSTPVVANGRVFIGTNNDEPRDPRHQGDRGVLMCLDEKTGALLWQLVVPKRSDDQYFDWPKCGISSPATVEGDRLYLLDNRGAVVCLDVHGMKNGNDGPFREEGVYMTPRPAPPPSFKPAPLSTDGAMEPGPLDADIIWIFDCPSGAGTWPHDGAHSSIVVQGEHLYVNTSTGVDNSHRVIRTPDAPSLIVLHKETGRLLARDTTFPAKNIFHCTWSSPSVGTVNGKELLFFAGGDGILAAFNLLPRGGVTATVPAELRRVWHFDPDPTAPKEEVHRFTNNKQMSPSNVYGMPVIVGERVYLAGGGDVFWGKNEAWLKCVDATGTGDMTRRGEVWSYALERHTLSTPAVYRGMVFIADTGRKLHCLDATTGAAHWTHDVQGDCWASPLVADEKVYLGTRKGHFWVLAAEKEKKLLSSKALKRPISATATAANETLYVATMTHLFALHRSSAN